MSDMYLKNILEIMLSQYYHIIGEQDNENLSTEKLIAQIVSYYEDILNCMPGNVYWFDKNCIGVGCNKNVLEMFGFKSLAEFNGISFEKMGHVGNWPPSAMQSFKNDTLEVMKTGRPKLNISEPPIPHSNGKIIYFLTSRVPLFNQQNNVIGCVGISIDITELKNSQDALKIAKEQAEAASLIKSEFVANMSHDVKTPLSGIIGMAELLTYRLEGEDLEFAQTLLASGRQLLTFFDNCLEVFKQSNEVALTVEHFNLQALLDEIYELFQPAIKTKGLIFSIYYPVHVPHYIIGSRTGTYRILLNLVSNAVKFTHQGRVIVHVDLDEHLRNQPMIKFTVEDTGIGIPKNKQKIIFERFTRLIPSYKGTYEGSGLGLSIVYKFIKSLRGEIFVKSEEGKGSQFTILLPIQILPCHEQKEDHENEVTHSALSNLAPITISKWGKSRLGASINIPVKVLLVEDNLTAQRMESSLLLSMNCHVDVVDSGERALDIFEPGKYDLIFMDIGLPGLQGDGVSRCIRKIEQGSLYHTPIIALTAHTNEAINNQYLAAGIEYIISKPLSLEQAKNIIERFL